MMNFDPGVSGGIMQLNMTMQQILRQLERIADALERQAGTEQNRENRYF